MTSYRWPLMKGQWHADDFNAVYNLFTVQDGPIRGGWNTDVRLTQGEQVRAFEEEFCRWQGCKHAVFVSSGASANLVTMLALRERLGRWQERIEYGDVPEEKAKVLVPCVTWSSDVSSTMLAGFEPVFVDCSLDTLGMDEMKCVEAIERHKPAAVFLTHVMGYNALDTEAIYKACLDNKVVLIEDCCESIGARTRWAGRKHKVGSFGLAANFSTYYAHHMTTVEGGMICTDDEEFYQTCRCIRGHGMQREFDQKYIQRQWLDRPDLDSNFVFLMPGLNARNTEIGAAIGRSQLKRLDANIEERQELHRFWNLSLDDRKFRLMDTTTSSPYALIVMLRDGKEGFQNALQMKIPDLLRKEGVEFRRGTAGGGNQLRQPYLRRLYGDAYKQYPNAEHVHFNAWQIGLFPGLPEQWVTDLAGKLNAL